MAEKKSFNWQDISSYMQLLNISPAPTTQARRPAHQHDIVAERQEKARRRMRKAVWAKQRGYR
jgi:hypothetical protein